MEYEAIAAESDILSWCLHQPSIPYHKLAALRPEFLIISPPKTGSTWLAANLRCHPAVFLPGVKELKYFSSYFKWLDWNWYLDHFQPADGRVKGEASPSYAILPVARIRLIRRLLPDVKLIYLMRDPVSRAWSHARHNYCYREANFAGYTEEFEVVTASSWCENFTHDWPLASGDYLGQLRRWLSVFPREQFYVGFFESIASSPQTLLREIFAFLGVASDVSFDSFRIGERILPGLKRELDPALKRFLQWVLRDRTVELESFLREQFGLCLPLEWQTTLESTGATPNGACPNPTAAFGREFDDCYLSRVVAQEETFASPPQTVLEGYRGYDLIFYRGRFHALDRNLGSVRVDEIDTCQLRDYEDRGSCFIALSLAEAKEQVDQHLLQQMQTELRAAGALATDLRDTRERLAHLERALKQVVADCHRLTQALGQVALDIEQLRTPWYRALVSRVRRAWRRLRACL